MANTSSNIIQTAPSTPSSSFSKPQSKYEVFLSFRGEDTRNTFTDHLYRALAFDKGIKTFRDDEELEMGSPIRPELLDAIETSRIAVIILSRNYASSWWCLEELANIVECMKERGMRVLPVFYHLDPSVVRYQDGSFKDAFAKHEERFEEKMVKKWRAALEEVAHLSGHHLKDGQSESKFIEDIVEKISQDMNDMNDMNDKNGLVGIDSRVQEIMDLYMDMASDDVRFIGIWGMSGIGKTTLAQVVFERVRHQFQASSFLSDVKRRDLGDSQAQLLQDMKLKKSEMPIRWDVLKGIRAISTRLSNKKVVIVLDDADEEKLEKLAGCHDWFGPGSRIFITTEDKGLLRRRCGKKNVYNAKKLNSSDALQLFSREAFGKPQCEKDLLDICNGFVSYVGGHPLALKILGSSMHDISEIDLWKAELERLRKSAELPKYDRIQTALRISCNGLSTPQKNLFLDVACFFNGEDKNRIADILEGSGCIPEIDIKALIDKSLITILGGKLWMHNLVQQMGWEIVNQECMKRPGERSRLWLCEDVLEVLNNSKGTDSVEGILLNAPFQKEVRLNNADAFSKMKKLRLLKICTHLHLPQHLSYLSNELHLMEWHDYPLKSMPTSFQPEKLVELVMHRSHIKQLPNGFGNLGRLKVMDLSDSQNLIKTPNFIGLPNLERVIFRGCTRLYKVHPSIGVLKRLTLLSLKDCKYLNSLPPEINLESLETLILSGCSRLKKFPDIGTSMTRLSKLYLDGTAIEELPLSIEHLTSLTLLYLQDCNNFSSFPSVIGSLTSLKTLILSGLKVRPHKPWHSLGLSPILSSIGAAALALWADFSLGLSPILLAIVAITLIGLWTYCLFIAKHPEPKPNLLLLKSLSGLGSLVCLDLSDCNLEDGALPNDLSCLSSLQSLNLSKNHFTCLPDSVSQLSKLKFLYLDNCSRLKSLTNIPLSTQYVMARECTSLENYSNQVLVWTSGESGFTFINCLSLGDNEECNMSDVNLESGFTFINCLNLGDDEECQICDVKLLDVHFQPLWQRYMKEKIEQSEGFQGVIPQTEIPKWFRHQNPGSIVPILLPPDLYENSNWRGIALCTVFVVNSNRDSKCFHEFICRLDIHGGVFDSPLVFTFPKDQFHPGSFGLWLYISQEKFRERVDVRGCISPSVTTNSPDVEIKLFGARLLYEGDMVQFVQKFSQKRFGSPDALRQHHQHFIHAHMNYSMCQKCCDPIPWLERELKKLLSRLYQGDPARNHWYDYIFPHISIPRWFCHPNFLSEIRMRLPPDLYNNTRWMGFSVYVVYTVYRQPYSSGQDPTIILSFSGLSAGETPFAPYKALPRSRDIFLGSRRLLVFYIPRVLFGLNQCSEIWASFQSNNPRVLKVETCGIRLVYEQDVEEFVEALLQCMLNCPSRRFHYENLYDQVQDLHGCDHGKDFSCSFSLQRRPKLLPSIENVAEEGCTSPETFSNQAGRNSTSLILGIPLRDEQCGSTSSIGIVQQTFLERWFKTHLQHYCNGTVFNRCFPQSEIPQWFCQQSDRPSVKIPLPPSLFNNPDWMGFAVCAVISFHKHPAAILMNLDSGFPHRVMCHTETDVGCIHPLLENSISEDEVLISLYQRSFIWVLFLPNWMFPRHRWSQSTWAKFRFISDSPDVSVLKCGVGLVDRQNMEEFYRTIVQLTTSGDGYLNDIRSSCKRGAVSERLPICVEKKKEGLHISPGNRHPHNRCCKKGCVTGPLDFDPSFRYGYCFPPSKVTQEWFSHQSRGHSVTLDIPPNVYNDNNWVGLAVCVCFSMVSGDLETIIANWSSEVQHFLSYKLRTIIAGLNECVASSCTSKKEILWLTSLGRFIWIAYVPAGQLLIDSMFSQGSRIEASFVSDWPGVTVQKCGLRLLYDHDQVEFVQNLKHCNALIFEHSDSLRQLMDDRGLTVHPSLFHLRIFERPARPCKSDLLEFDGCSEYNLCFPPREILNWFSHRSNGPSVTIDVPANLYDDKGWMGLILCAYFSVHDEDQTAIPEKPDSAISYNLICSLESNVAGPQLEIHVHGTTKEELRRLYIQDEFHWLSYIPRGSLPDWLNQSSCLEASFASDWPGLVVRKCGLRFFHVHDEQEFEKIIYRCCFVSENRGFDPSKSESRGSKKQHCKKDFDPCLVFNSCFLPRVMYPFSHRIDEPQGTFRCFIPPNLFDDPTWMGLCLLVLFSVREPCTIACNLICRLETDIGSLEHLHMYCLTKEDLMLFGEGAFIWETYIPRGSLPKGLNQSSFIKVSIKTYCRSAFSFFYSRLGLTVQEFDFRPGYLKAAEPSAASSSDGTRLQDKAKGIAE